MKPKLIRALAVAGLATTLALGGVAGTATAAPTVRDAVCETCEPGGGTGGGTGGGGTTTPQAYTYRVEIVSLKCWSTSENGADETMLRAARPGSDPGSKFWGAYPMANGSELVINQAPQQLYFNSAVELQVWDADSWPDGDDRIGTVVIDGTMATGEEYFLTAEKRDGDESHGWYGVRFRVVRN
ncbi:hypothetical protein [Kitasatospora purpeofusca]|uniref:hypothetical protein n=1 Tax=Kitasatospora purpeofusca TaxID=67352 RepID=UPI0036D3825D